MLPTPSPFTIQKATLSRSLDINGADINTYSLVSGTLIEFEDNPSDADLWNVPRKTQSLETMNYGGINVDFGIDRSKQSIKIKVSLSTQAFKNQIFNIYYNDVDQIYLLTSHADEKWVIKWKDLQAKYLSTLPLEFKSSVPIPIGMDINTPYAKYADVYELNMEFFVVDYGVQI